ncbi:unnamed protein product [Phytophthora fragariaefolia]|uniref:Unnamed protein product n=1 Tax=Phytophthora fragariaefolia TaxID=1490495 RepID=A0A9W6Y310_9STRA|nr:unnamed protein product [Phytophthora fragariaefolia]
MGAPNKEIALIDHTGNAAYALTSPVLKLPYPPRQQGITRASPYPSFNTSTRKRSTDRIPTKRSGKAKKQNANSKSTVGSSSDATVSYVNFALATCTPRQLADGKHDQPSVPEFNPKEPHADRAAFKHHDGRFTAEGPKTSVNDFSSKYLKTPDELEAEILVEAEAESEVKEAKLQAEAGKTSVDDEEGRSEAEEETGEDDENVIEI